MRKTLPPKRLGHDPPANIANYPVRRLEKSVMSDHIGISTLAVTTDGYVIILHQNDKALTSTDRLTPSGIGIGQLQRFASGLRFQGRR